MSSTTSFSRIPTTRTAILWWKVALPQLCCRRWYAVGQKTYVSIINIDSQSKEDISIPQDVLSSADAVDLVTAMCWIALPRQGTEYVYSARLEFEVKVCFVTETEIEIVVPCCDDLASRKILEWSQGPVWALWWSSAHYKLLTDHYSGWKE